MTRIVKILIGYWTNIKKNAPVISLVISGIAIWFSYRSCVDSTEALEITKKEFISKRTLILQAERSGLWGSIKFNPFDSNHKIQKLEIYFPGVFTSRNIIVDPPYFEYNYSDLFNYLKAYLHNATKKHYIENTVLYLPSVPVPVVIRTNFIAEGESFWQTSLYNLEFRFKQYHLNDRGIELEFVDIHFIKIWSDQTNFSQVLEKLWENQLDGLLNEVANNCE